MNEILYFYTIEKKIFHTIRKHIVIYLGIGQPQMPSQLKVEEIFTGFDIINIHPFDTQTLLSSQIPHVVLLAVLAEYPKEQTERILRLIVKRLKATSSNASELSKFLKQLIILSRLRKIEDLTIKITEEMPITYDIETDYLYLKGIEKGIEKDKAEVVKNMILQTDFDDAKIASIVIVSIPFVQNIRKKMKKLNK